MGPTYVKLGQVLSGRPDLLPEPYLKALARLQDKVKPFAFEEVERIVTEELSVRLSKAFTSFDSEPLAGRRLAGPSAFSRVTRWPLRGGQSSATQHSPTDRGGF